jgi:hypothetical protein
MKVFEREREREKNCVNNSRIAMIVKEKDIECESVIE